jgi:MarR family transcriptional regulator, negative regulator of the multidrug operon emrRAB
MSANPSPLQGSLELRAAEIEAAIARIADRFPEVDASDTLILRLLMLLGRALGALLEYSLRPHDLNDTDFRILMSLVSQPDGVASPSDLCSFVAQSPANMTRVADALYERGLITRTASEHDRRRTMLRITTAGENLVRSLLPAATTIVREIFGDMPQSNRLVLLEQLRALTAQIDRRPPTG